MTETVEFETQQGTEVTLEIEQNDVDQTQAVITANIDVDDIPKQEVKPRKALFDRHDEPYEIVMEDNSDEYDTATITVDAKTYDRIESAIDVVTAEHRATVEDALKEAKEKGVPVQIGQQRTTYCNDITKECNIDHVRTVAYPSGEVKEERIHTF